ncbi:MAG: hypothetical protein NZ903_01705, partial [Candidatus Micrarchaeota archaeon]|nr:hypothetical protein [Candidatus Micrarchaeota archaeon]
MLNNIIKMLESKVPSYITNRVKQLLLFAGVEEYPERWFIKNAIMSIFFSFAFLLSPIFLLNYLPQSLYQFPE